MKPQGGQSRYESRFHIPVLWLSIVLAGAVASTASGQHSVSGKWDWVNQSRWDSLETGKLVRGGGTHMALLRGAADSAWIAHWHSGEGARVWQPTSVTDSVGIMVEVPWSSTHVFCSGHATLADGKLLVVGGALTGETGEKRCATFDATNCRSAGGGWNTVRQTSQGHWYPTVTTRGDGTVAATGGSEWNNLVLVGGAVGGSEAPANEMRILNLPDTTHWNMDPIAGLKPMPRHGHSATYWNGFQMIFGGDLGRRPPHLLPRTPCTVCGLMTSIRGEGGNGFEHASKTVPQSPGPRRVVATPPL